jgi:hypothetical protein
VAFSGIHRAFCSCNDLFSPWYHLFIHQQETTVVVSIAFQCSAVVFIKRYTCWPSDSSIVIIFQGRLLQLPYSPKCVLDPTVSIVHSPYNLLWLVGHNSDSHRDCAPATHICPTYLQGIHYRCHSRHQELQCRSQRGQLKTDLQHRLHWVLHRNQLYGLNYRRCKQRSLRVLSKRASESAPYLDTEDVTAVLACSEM